MLNVPYIDKIQAFINENPHAKDMFDNINFELIDIEKLHHICEVLKDNGSIIDFMNKNSGVLTQLICADYEDLICIRELLKDGEIRDFFVKNPSLVDGIVKGKIDRACEVLTNSHIRIFIDSDTNHFYEFMDMEETDFLRACYMFNNRNIRGPIYRNPWLLNKFILMDEVGFIHARKLFDYNAIRGAISRNPRLLDKFMLMDEWGLDRINKILDNSGIVKSFIEKLMEIDIDIDIDIDIFNRFVDMSEENFTLVLKFLKNKDFRNLINSKHMNEDFFTKLVNIGKEHLFCVLEVLRNRDTAEFLSKNPDKLDKLVIKGGCAHALKVFKNKRFNAFLKANPDRFDYFMGMDDADFSRALEIFRLPKFRDFCIVCPGAFEVFVRVGEEDWANIRDYELSEELVDEYKGKVDGEENKPKGGVLTGVSLSLGVEQSEQDLLI